MTIGRKKHITITVLIEDTPGREGFKYEHGLSLYIETPHHRVLMDAGASDAVVDNAAAAGIDLVKTDTMVLSHGHYDHSGGLIAAAKIARGEHIFMQRQATYDFYHGDRYIGIDNDILGLPNVHLLDGAYRPDDELYIFSNISGSHLRPRCNSQLTRLENGVHVPDEFEHEQCLVLTSHDGNILLSGCAHNGILNILERYHEIFGGQPRAVVSGFHMLPPGIDGLTDEDRADIAATARELAAMDDTVFYTGHCTGQEAFDIMKPIMGDQLIQIHSGDVINF